MISQRPVPFLPDPSVNSDCTADEQHKLLSLRRQPPSMLRPDALVTKWPKDILPDIYTRDSEAIVMSAEAILEKTSGTKIGLSLEGF